ncbi:hypothetical protein [Desulfosporosinus meridiei]|uniref:Uncharacterized protein n=1 Tax=Desulfosporosinus meridiei (strain ATCC BAA-275 / DSM 13257 / KCTC 12902 / NCIMB 13706 / S10) TaxID=768704 RepID=J7IP68_DESMD|nr:hypothetical protein [Desulfosporosinus meridiei]AFQ43390.1 hypothetical protein Desmer_1393 [Desulfosporosinus meridiei DSM 13257]
MTKSKNNQNDKMKRRTNTEIMLFSLVASKPNFGKTYQPNMNTSPVSCSTIQTDNATATTCASTTNTEQENGDGGD